MPTSSLVTGATGFLGSRLVRALLDRGQSVKALVRPGSNLSALAGLPGDRFKLAVGDVRLEPSVFAALAGCSRLYHLAANVKLWDADPARIIEPAVAGTRAVLRAAERRGLEKVVVTSTVGVLGSTSAEEPMDETHAFNLNDPEAYFAAKVSADEVAREFSQRGLAIVSVLPSLVLGPGDWKPSPNGRRVLEYLRTPPTRHFAVAGGGVNLVDVDDVVEGHVRAMERGRVGERYVLGGDNLSFSQIFETLADITGLGEPSAPKSQRLLGFAGRWFELAARLRGGEPRITTRLARDYAGRFSWVTSAKAEAELGYAHRPARDTLARAVRWFLANGYVPAGDAARLRLELQPT